MNMYVEVQQNHSLSFPCYLEIIISQCITPENKCMDDKITQ